jgi:atypical dual specificity phosphatase
MPYNFSWVIPGRLAGLSQPGLGEARDWRREARNLRRGGLASQLAELRALGVDCLVSLTDSAAAFGPPCAAAGLSWEYFPIPEFDIPEDSAAFHSLVERLLARLARGQALAVHCYAGVGRTGLLLACLLGRLERLPGEEAIRRLRLLRPALETPEQEEFVRRYLREHPFAAE